MMHDIRLLVVDEGPGLTRDLLLALRRRPGWQVLGPVVDDAAAIGVLVRETMDLVVVDLERRDQVGVAIVTGIRNASDVRVMVAMQDPGSSLVELALAAGACGVLPARGGPSHVADALRRALAGELVLPAEDHPALVDALWQARARRSERSLLATLTAREREILAALVDGSTTSEIAHGFGISPTTVQTHVKNVLGKLGVHSKVEAFGAAWRAGLVLSSRSA